MQWTSGTIFLLQHSVLAIRQRLGTGEIPDKPYHHPQVAVDLPTQRDPSQVELQLTLTALARGFGSLRHAGFITPHGHGGSHTVYCNIFCYHTFHWSSIQPLSVHGFLAKCHCGRTSIIAHLNLMHKNPYLT